MIKDSFTDLRGQLLDIFFTRLLESPRINMVNVLGHVSINQYLKSLRNEG